MYDSKSTLQYFAVPSIQTIQILFRDKQLCTLNSHDRKSILWALYAHFSWIHKCARCLCQSQFKCTMKASTLTFAGTSTFYVTKSAIPANVLSHTQSGTNHWYCITKWLHMSILPSMRWGRQHHKFPLLRRLFVPSREALCRMHYSLEWRLCQRNNMKKHCKEFLMLPIPHQETPLLLHAINPLLYQQLSEPRICRQPRNEYFPSFACYLLQWFFTSSAGNQWTITSNASSSDSTYVILWFPHFGLPKIKKPQGVL